MAEIKLFLFLLMVGALPLDSFAQQNITFNHGGLTRNYHLYLPADLPQDAPLIFVLHGYMQSNNWAQGNLGFDDIADTGKFAVCYPQGTVDVLGQNHWNARLNLSSVDDVGFLSALAQYLQTEHNLNPNATFSCGFSNGGFMSYTLACDAPEVFKAIASVSGTMSGDTWNNCSTTNKTPVLQFHGIDDTTVPIDGSMTTLFGWGGAPQIRTIVDFWANKNTCPNIGSMQVTPNTEVFYHENGTGDNEVWYYEIANHGHVWPGTAQSGVTDNSGINASQIIWKFFNEFCNKLTSFSDFYLDVNSISHFSNPESGKLILKGNLNEFDIHILDESGLLFQDLITSDDVLEFNSNLLPAGLFFISISHDNISNLEFRNIIQE